MKKDLERIYLNEARIAEAKTFDDVDNLIEQLRHIAVGDDEDGSMYPYKLADKKAMVADMIVRLINLWDQHFVSASTLEAMLDKTYGEIIDDDGDWYIREDRELQKKEEIRAHLESKGYSKEDLDRYIEKNYKPEEDDDEYI